MIFWPVFTHDDSITEKTAEEKRVKMRRAAKAKRNGKTLDEAASCWEYLAGLGREKKKGIEGRLFEMAVLEPSSKVLEVLVSAWRQGAA